MLTQSEIEKILPHKPPLLLVHKVLELNPGISIKAEVHLDPEWAVFKAHFPSYPVLPGIYLTESLAQTADILLLKIPGNQGKLPLLTCVSQMRYLRPVFPGNIVTLTAELVTDAGNGMYDCKVCSFLEHTLTAAGILTLALK